MHGAGVVFVQSTQNAVFFILAVLARKRFGASEIETTLITAAPTILFVTGIFWNDIFRRSKLGKYLWVYWLIACAPLLLAPLITQYWHLLLVHILVCVGIAGYHPAAGELLRHLYPDASRGRLFSVLSGMNMLFNAAIGYGVGKMLDHDPDSFRWYMPVAGVLQGLGVAVFFVLAKKHGVIAARQPAVEAGNGGVVGRVLDPIKHMKIVLKEDRVFYRYEAAYMTYGVGWMVCYAMIPLMATDKFKLTYEQVAESTHVAYLVALVLALFPCGWAMDRLGAARTSGISFAALTLYPVGLLIASDAKELAIVSAFYGLAHSGTHLGWTLGPVSLAPTPAKVPQYVAIHATLVGLRGAIFQFLGVLIYKVSGSFVAPLVLAAIAFAWSAYQMLGLDSMLQGRAREKKEAEARAAERAAVAPVLEAEEAVVER
jgi:MFS family permease